MKAYSYKCPIDFMPMFDQVEKLKGKNWEGCTGADLIPYLAYEGFYFTKYDQEKFLKCIEDDDDRELLEHCLEPVINDYYELKWEGVQGVDNPRLLFYGRGDRHSRLRDMNSDGSRFNYEISEIEWLFEILAKNHIRWDIKSENDPVITIYHPNQSEMLILYPCCPKCYTILPGNWFCAEDYFPISLLAPMLGGKTTLLCSWLVNNFEAFTRLRQMGNDYEVFYGITGGKDTFKIQSYFYDCADMLYKEGKYPEGTELNCVPPMYMQIHNRINDETLLVGIYDCAGEMLRQAINGFESATAFLKHMSAFIYLVEAGRMYGVNMEPDREEKKEETCWEIIPLNEQGKLQQETPGPVSALSLVEHYDRVIEDPWEIYNGILQVLRREKTNRSQHMAFSIIKSDELRGRPEVKAIRNSEILFRDPDPGTALNQDYIFQANRVAKEIFRQLVIEGTDEEKNRMLENLESDFLSVSWHCVCAAEPPREGELYHYRSIRKIDPLVGCLLGELEKIDWQ